MNTKTTVISQAELDAQFACCDKIAAYWQTKGRTPTAYVETYGCQQNEADSEKLRGFLAQCGYAIVGSAEGADVVIMNTCAIREHAEQRVFGNLGALTHTKRRHPEQKIFLCGCMAGETKVSDRVKHSYPHVDGVFSTHHLWQFPQILWNVLSGKKRQFFIEDEPGSIAEGIPQVRDSKLKAWVSIMYGCNNFCTYCIVPYVRGRERSRQPEDILAECRALIEGGTKEITLLGQNVNSYGKDLSCGMDFADLLAAEITAKTGKNPAQLHQEQVERFGESWYKRVDTPTTLEQKAKFAALSGDDVTASTLAGEDITAKLTEAPGNHAKIGGLKVTTKDNWFAARPSGTENIYKVYAESFVSPEALDKVLDEATVVVDKALSE